MTDPTPLTDADLRVQTLGEHLGAVVDEYGAGLSRAAVVGALEMVKQEIMLDGLGEQECNR